MAPPHGSGRHRPQCSGWLQLARLPLVALALGSRHHRGPSGAPAWPARWALPLASRRGASYAGGIARRIRFKDGHSALLVTLSHAPAAWEIIGLLSPAEASRLLRAAEFSAAGGAHSHDFSASARSATSGTATFVRNATTAYPDLLQARIAHQRLAELLGFARTNISDGKDRSRILAYGAGGYYLPHFDSLLSGAWQSPPPIFSLVTSPGQGP
eukprot:gnl/TRDRNA2_/TRDRNA2_93292_c0_seq4.p1 gnl/TRDRNA2_/TRDRNA2_93292_c0~~gnl/TRDRNA2_/TRDRNA2_93292_c0_seq4.p1  ORF type:complete len:213 (+),score=9.21 gnl/TRDRNA2_/TRDRNA2_93292_c0_seq4:16-654(+)